MNRKSIGIECLGDYRNYTLRDWDARVLGAFWRPQDLKFGGATAVYGHREVSDSSTECPARIMEMRDTVVAYCTKPPLPPAPLPVITTKTDIVTTTIPFTKINVEDITKTNTTIKLGINGIRTVIYLVTLTDGKETSRVVTSDTTIPPINEVITVGTYVPPILPPIDLPVVILPIETIWQRFVAWIIKFIKGVK